MASRVLRIPLFWKLTGAQILLLALAGLTVVVVLEGSGDADVGSVLALVALATVAVAGAISAWLTRVALSPLEAISEAAERIRGGDLDVRAPSSPIADPSLDGVGETLNELLESLDYARRKQRDLSLQVLRSHERERGRISGDLYDRTAQTLAGVLVRLKVMGRAHPEESAGLATVTDEVRNALHEVRAVARRLRPPELNDLGLRSALEALAREVHEGSGVAVHFIGELPEAELDEDVRLVLFRVVEEALDNVVRHAGTLEARVHFRTRPGVVEVEIHDDGLGFDPKALGVDGVPRLGLVTMIERAGYARGGITVTASPGAGTRVRLVLPRDGDPVLARLGFGGAPAGETSNMSTMVLSHPDPGGLRVR